MRVVLRKKENPVPMYAMNTRLPPNSPPKYMIVPVVEKKVGFDLIEYDWMPPYGKGKRTDFIIEAVRTYTNDRDFDSTLTITFPNLFDGIQLYKEDRTNGSIFKLPRFAPVTGYSSKLVVKKTLIPKKGVINDSDNTNNYFFRVRSEEKDGKLIRAMYGKIHGDIEIDPRGNDTLVIIIKYFLNPDYTRNMEFGENLFMGLNIGTD